MSNNSENIDVTKDIVEIEKTARELSNRTKEIKVVTTEEIEIRSRKTLGLFGAGKADAIDTQEGFTIVNSVIMDTNNNLIALNNIVQEIPEFLEELSKNQLQKIAISQKTANSALSELGEQYEVLKKFKVKIDKLEHITSVDSMYNNLTTQNESIEAIQVMIEEIQLKNTELEQLIDEENSKLSQQLKEYQKNFDQKLEKKNKEFDKNIKDCIELRNKIELENEEFKNEISEFFTVKREDIDKELKKNQSEINQQLSEQKTELEHKNNELQIKLKNSYYLSGLSILLTVIMFILIVLGVI